MHRLITIIHEYESDTFSGADLSEADAQRVAALLFTRFLKVVREGGTLRCDGDVLASLYADVTAED
jgi:hypothetical protein